MMKLKIGPDGIEAYSPSKLSTYMGEFIDEPGMLPEVMMALINLARMLKNSEGLRLACNPSGALALKHIQAFLNEAMEQERGE